MTYLGPPFVYGFEKIGNDCGVVGKLAQVAFDGRLAWMGRRNFWMYDGSVKPLPCDVSDYVFNNLNQEQVEKVHTAHLPRWGEIWWFYPSGSSIEPDSYVVYNYREGHWSIGTMARTCWVSDNGVWSYPTAVKSTGEVYEQENGWTDDGGSREVYAQSGPIEIGQGGQTLWVNQVIPDEESVGAVLLRFYTKFAPNDTAVSHGPYIIGSDYVDTRLQGRQISMRIEEAKQEDWRWGIPRLNARAGSGR
jgi:hypothetical protein